MVALFHAKSRTCINQFVKVSQLNGSEGSSLLCDRSRFAAGRKAADDYLKGCDKRHKSDAAERHKKIENVLSRVDVRNRPALAVAEVSLAHAMPPTLLTRAAQGHIEAAEKSVGLHMWSNAEQELMVIENLYAQAALQGVAPASDVCEGVQRVRDMAAEARCRDILNVAQQHCERQLFGAAQTAIMELTSAVRSLSSSVSAEGHTRLQNMVIEATDLRLTAELGADQAAMEAALALLRHGDAPAARNQLQLLAAQIAARPVGHPSHEDMAAIGQAIRDCEESQGLDADCAALGRAQSMGDLRQVHAMAARIKLKLARLSPDLACKTSAGIITGLRAWDPHRSNIVGFAQLLEQSRGYNVANRNVVEGTIRALGALEGPAGPFSVNVGDASLRVPTDPDTFNYPSLKARIAAEAPPPRGNDAIITLRMGGQHMYFHSGNYTAGLADIIETAPHIFGEYAARARTRAQFETLFDALGFTCVEAQLSALQQADLDPLQEDLVGKHSSREKCDEYLRVFYLKQIRKYAADHGLNPDGHREEIDAKQDFTRQYFNARLFRNYLSDKGFWVGAAEMDDLMRYEIDIVGVLGE